VTVILGGRITSDISLGFDGRALGRHAFSFGDGPDAPWQKAVSGVAGSEAEQIMFGRETPHAGEVDRRKARELAFDPANADQWVGEARQRARDILYAHLELVGELARQLERRGTVSASKATALIQRGLGR
jgi:hypothetical protein